MTKNPSYTAYTRLLFSEKSATYTTKWSYTIIWQVRVGRYILLFFHLTLTVFQIGHQKVSKCDFQCQKSSDFSYLLTYPHKICEKNTEYLLMFYQTSVQKQHLLRIICYVIIGSYSYNYLFFDKLHDESDRNSTNC